MQQMLTYICLTPLASADSSTSSRLVDAMDSVPLTPVSLLELAHAQQQQVTLELRVPPTVLAPLQSPKRAGDFLK